MVSFTGGSPFQALGITMGNKHSHQVFNPIIYLGLKFETFD